VVARCAAAIEPAVGSSVSPWPKHQESSGGCAGLLAVARTYHDLTDEAGELREGVHVTEREARLAGQVLRVVMRDLDPGR
jgi:hypothetical protein